MKKLARKIKMENFKFRTIARVVLTIISLYRAVQKSYAKGMKKEI
jgi:hypothetical protein